MNVWLNEKTSRKSMVGPYMVLAITGAIALNQIGDVAAAQAASAERYARVSAYNACVGRISTREDLRSVLLGITGLFPQSDPGVRRIVDLIETDYPSLDVAECGPVPE